MVLNHASTALDLKPFILFVQLSCRKWVADGGMELHLKSRVRNE